MDNDERLAQLEARIGAIEQYLGIKVKVTGATPARPAVSNTPPPTVATPHAPPPQRIIKRESLGVTHLLGWSGATALVIASIYLVMLAIDSGWLTPAKQVSLAMLGGIVCIATGLLLRHKDARYASMLPAAGVVILFLSTYGAHNYYHLIDFTFATSAVVAITLLSLWLNRVFMSDLYAVFAVLGSYTAPLFLSGTHFDIADLIVYFACWSVLFSVFAIKVSARGVYLLAMYLALMIFDYLWQLNGSQAWREALSFQTAHFFIFICAAAIYSIRIAPMTQGDGLKHVPALVLFYFVQYHILQTHLPAYAPWVAIASALVVAAAYYLVRLKLAHELEGGRVLLSSYVALVLVHAGYIESVPAHWAPWFALLLLPVLAGYAHLRGGILTPGKPLWAAVGLLFLANYLKLLDPGTLSAGQVPAQNLLGLAYAAELYLAYYWLRKDHALRDLSAIVLYAGHVAMMAWALHLFDNRFVVSLVWACFALACLSLALLQRNKLLGQSSLLIFAASLLKALLYDVALATPLIRIASLAVVGVSLYLGGWLYKKVNALDQEAT